MNDERTTPPEEPTVPPSLDERFPALVIVWSTDEPARAGEVAVLLQGGPRWILGRGDDLTENRVRFVQQRPGMVERRPALASPGISREQLSLLRVADVLRVERKGLPAMRVNGAPTDAATVRVGDTIEIERQLLLFVTERPADMPDLRHARVEMAFGEADPDGILGESPAAWRLREDLAFARAAAGHVLVTGESGTGKELAARAIHARSTRASGPLVSQNAATFPPGLVDAELFGHARNYPHSGMPERPGLVGEAHGGVFFLDEIGELPPELHARLLRVLDDGGEYRRLGETHPRRSDLRLVAATNRDASALKHDLLARLRLRIGMPSLRERREDVPLFVRKLVLEAAEISPPTARRFVTTLGARQEVKIAAGLVDRLVRHPYETNLREIMMILADSMRQSPRDVLLAPPLVEGGGRAEAAAGRSDVPAPREKPPEEVRIALARAGGNVTAAAHALGMSRQALYRFLERHGIEHR